MPRLSLIALTSIALMALTGSAKGSSGSTSPLPLREVALLQLPGPANRFDYMALDQTSDVLWIAHMNASELLAFNLRTRKVVLRIPAPGVHGVIVVPSLGRVYATATDTHEVLTIDSKSGAILARAQASEYPDGLAFDPVEQRVFVSDEANGEEAVINAKGRRVATIMLGGQAGNTQYDPVSGRIMVAVQSLDQLALIDPKDNRITRRVPLPGCSSSHGLIIDAPRRLAFVGCDQNATLLTVDLNTMKVIGTAHVGVAPDVLAFDTALRRLYVASEDGEVHVFAERAHGLRSLGGDFLATAAHTVAVDPRTHFVYMPLQGPDGRPHMLIMKPV